MRADSHRIQARHVWQLERLRQGELSGQGQAQLEAQLEVDPSLQAHLEALAAEDARLLERIPPGQLAGEVERRARHIERQSALAEEGHTGGKVRRPAPGWSHTSRRLWSVIAPGMAVATLALLMMRMLQLPGLDDDRRGPPGTPMVHAPDPDPRTRPDNTREKGLEPQIRVYRLESPPTEHSAQPLFVSRLADGSEAAPQTVLQLSYLAPGYAYGAILSVDGAGTVTLHHPGDTRLPPRIDPSGEHQLEHAYELDAAPGFERFVFLFSRQPFDVQTALAAARSLANHPSRAATEPLEVPAAVHQTSFLLKKRTP